LGKGLRESDIYLHFYRLLLLRVFSWPFISAHFPAFLTELCGPDPSGVACLHNYRDHDDLRRLGADSRFR